jgi:hypothetical protein
VIYLDYEQYKRKYLDTQKSLDSKLSEKEQMLQKGDSESLKQIDETIDGLKAALDDRGMLLKQKERELFESNNPDDIAYRLRYIEKMKVKRISRIIHYSDTQTYRILQNIQEILNKAVMDSQVGRK